MVNDDAHHVYMIIIFNYRLGFRDMSTVTTISGWVYHMEIDKRFTHLSEYKLLTYNTRDKRLNSIAGSSSTRHR